MLTLNPQSAWCLATKWARVRDQPFGGSGQWRIGSDHYPRSLNLSPGLFGVTPIGKERASRFADYKSARGSGKPAKVSDIGEMRDHKGIQMVAVEDGY